VCNFPAGAALGAKVNRIRLQLSMTSVEPKDNGRLLIKGNAILEIENSQTSALVAETLPLVVP
jgi:hypothetical protein